MQIVRRLRLIGLVAMVASFPTLSPAQPAMQTTEIAAAARAATVQIRALDAQSERLSSGSGFIVTTDGTIVTNFHVIDRAERLEVELPNGEIYTNVYYVASDPRRDIAILKVPADRLAALRLGDDTELAVGARVYTMGNPLGQTATFSDGLVSAQRTVEGVAMVQITAPISSGSSGGPVMNQAGEVIGVATMILQGGQNLNFSVPVRYVRPLLAMGDRPRPYTLSLLPGETGGLAAIRERARRARTSVPSTPAPTAPSRDQFTGEVKRQLDGIGAGLSSEFGSRRIRDLGPGWLNLDESADHWVRLSAGQLYTVVGVCDSDCTDLDLRLYNAAGTLLESDLRVTNVPLLTFFSPTTGEYRIRVTMHSCSVQPCRYGATVLEERD